MLHELVESADELLARVQRDPETSHAPRKRPAKPSRRPAEIWSRAAEALAIYGIIYVRFLQEFENPSQSIEVVGRAAGI